MVRFFTSRKFVIVLAVVFFLLGIGLRVYLAAKLSFMYDELWAFHFANRSHSIWQHIVQPFDDRAPLHYLLLKLQSSVSDEMLWLRLPSILCSATVLIWMARYLRKISFSFAIILIFLGTINYPSIRYATQARDYGFIVVAAWIQIASIWNWIKPSAGVSQQYMSRKDGLKWMIASFMGVGLNYIYIPFLLSILGALGIIWSWQWRQAKLPINVILRRILVIGLLSLPTLAMAGYYLLVYDQLRIVQATTEWILPPTARDIFELLAIHFELGANWSWQALLFGMGLLLIGWLKGWEDKQDRQFLSFGFLTITLNIALIAIPSLFGSSLFLLRYFAPLSIVSLLFVTYGVWKLWQMFNQPTKIFIFIWFLVGYVPYMVADNNIRLGFYGSLEKYGTEQTRLVETIKTVWKPGDQLVFSPKTYGMLYRDYYFHDGRYPGNDEIAQQIEPIFYPICQRRKKLAFTNDNRLIIAAVSERAYGQPDNILISESTTNIHPNFEVPLSELCKDEPVSLFKGNQTAVWMCHLKEVVALTQYCYLDD